MQTNAELELEIFEGTSIQWSSHRVCQEGAMYNQTIYWGTGLSLIFNEMFCALTAVLRPDILKQACPAHFWIWQLIQEQTNMRNLIDKP